MAPGLGVDARGFIIEVEAFDWNCPQHITPRFTEAQVEGQLAALRTENRHLKDLLAGAANRQPAIYVCGPQRLISAVTDVAKALGMARERVRLERFA